MTIQEHSLALDARLRLAPALFAVTLFASALLLFAVQPMFTKMVLPMLGGAPAVWSVAMVFFQGALLIGYAYAHLLARTLNVGQAALVHLGVLAAAALTLPIGVAHGFDVPPSSGIGLWLVALFAASIGLPFAALSASAPLLQSWFAASGHAQARNPYVLYAASNLGSFAALLAYPLALESLLTLRMQAWAWSVGFAGLALLIAAGGADRGARKRHRSSRTATVQRPTWRDRAVWAALAAIPAGLVIAVTAYISTDIAAAPLLWVLPLALYLLTFVAVFREKPWFSHDLVAQDRAVSGGAACHHAARRRPRILARLDGAQSAGAVCAGARVSWRSLRAPSGACAAHRVLSLDLVRRRDRRHLRRPARAASVQLHLRISDPGHRCAARASGRAARAQCATSCGASRPRSRSFRSRSFFTLPASGYRAALAGAAGRAGDARRPDAAAAARSGALRGACGLRLHYHRRCGSRGCASIEQTRSFFGVHRVVETISGTHRMLVHGNTIHGAERIREAGRDARHRPAGAADLLLFRRTDFGSDERGSCGRGGQARQCRGGRARCRKHGLPPPRGRDLDLLRDRSRGRAPRARSEHVPLPRKLRAGCADRARRCAPDACCLKPSSSTSSCSMHFPPTRFRRTCSPARRCAAISRILRRTECCSSTSPTGTSNCQRSWPPSARPRA